MGTRAISGPQMFTWAGQWACAPICPYAKLYMLGCEPHLISVPRTSSPKQGMTVRCKMWLSSGSCLRI